MTFGLAMAYGILCKSKKGGCISICLTWIWRNSRPSTTLRTLTGNRLRTTSVTQRLFVGNAPAHPSACFPRGCEWTDGLRPPSYMELPRDAGKR
jgi:hypothetical protein